MSFSKIEQGSLIPFHYNLIVDFSCNRFEGTFFSRNSAISKKMVNRLEAIDILYVFIQLSLIDMIFFKVTLQCID